MLLFVTAGKGEILKGAHPVGVGLINFSIGLTTLLEKVNRQVEEIIFLGTMGSYWIPGNSDRTDRSHQLEEGPVIGDIVESWRGVQWEWSWLLGKSYTPISNRIDLKPASTLFPFLPFSVQPSIHSTTPTFPFSSNRNRKGREKGTQFPPDFFYSGFLSPFKGKKREVLPRLKESNLDRESQNRPFRPLQNRLLQPRLFRGGIINSSNYITTDSQIASTLFQKGIVGESMEFFAFLKVANRFNLPARAFLVVTNYSSPSAHFQYRQNLPFALILLEEIKTALKMEYKIGNWNQSG